MNRFRRGNMYWCPDDERNFEHFKRGLPKFHLLALLGKTDKLGEMLSKNNKICSTVDVYGRTALHIAASHAVYTSLTLLCKNCSKETLDHPDCYRFTALHYAVQGANTHCARLLLESGCDVNPTQFALYTPLHLAASYGYPQLVALLCKYGANVHARSSSQETPLQMAARSGIRIREKLKIHYTTLALLLKFGSDAKVEDNDGTTPLHYVAMHCEREQCAALLCAAGASVRSRNHGNVTAVQAARGGEVRSFLRKVQRTPPKLEHFCLLIIREKLGTNLENKTEGLPLPKPLKDKILFKTLPRVI